MDEIEELQRALVDLGSPVLGVRRDGLSATEVLAEAQRHLPWWVEYVDEDICAWYSWHNGADPGRMRIGGESAQGSCVITPDGLSLRGIHEFWSPGWEILGSAYAQGLGVVFPLGTMDSTAGDLFLRRESPADEWRVWGHWLESGFQRPELPVGYDVPTFREWLKALAGAMRAGRLVLGRFGQVAVRDAEIGPWTSAHHYPWLG